MPTAIASGRTLDGFMVDPLITRTHNTVIELVKADSSLSDHHLVSLCLKEYVCRNQDQDLPKRTKEVDSLLRSVYWVGSPIFRKDRGSNAK